MGRTRSQSLLSKEGDSTPAAASSDNSDGYLSEELGLEIPTRLTSKKPKKSKPIEEEKSVRGGKRKSVAEEKPVSKRNRRSRTVTIEELEDDKKFAEPDPPKSAEKEKVVRAASLPASMEETPEEATMSILIQTEVGTNQENNDELQLTVEPVTNQERTMEYMTQTETQVPEEQPSSSSAPAFARDMSKAPHFPQQPVARQNEDGSLELECYVDANPKPEIKWFYDNKEVKPDGRFSLKLDTRGNDQYSAILTIKDLADSDAGAYRCAIVNPHGKGNANFNLKLTGFSSPTFVEKPQISSRDDGQIMVMEFRAKSILKPVFVWSKGDEIVSPSDRVHVVLREEPNQIYYAALEIKDPTKEKDAGQFVCTAKNDSGKLTATFTVKFEVPQGAPTFTRKPQILQKTSDSGDPAIVFDIGYQADRNPEVIWINPKGKKMKESSRIKFATSSDGGSNTYTATLELKNYKAKDSGTYTCNIKNDAGEANVELTLNIEGPMDDGADENSDA